MVGAIATIGMQPAKPALAQTGFQTVSLKFQAKVGSQAFRCGMNYSGLGNSAAAMTAMDFRFYVSEVALIDAQGQVVPITLTQDAKWQSQNAALLDFEDKTGACANGTVEVNDRIVGTVPKGMYKGLRFTLGLPFSLNHQDAAIASSPFNLTSLWWNWQSGYKFARIDLMPAAQETRAKHEGQGQPAKSTQPKHGSSGFPIHIGSTGCQVVSGQRKPKSCINRNAAIVTFDTFDVQKDVVVADLKALVSETNLNINHPYTPMGCMSAPQDGDCEGIMKNLGLPSGGKTDREQQFFRVAREQ
jgi:uncharacterized repeat protein (TIGR04052 family)